MRGLSRHERSILKISFECTRCIKYFAETTTVSHVYYLKKKRSILNILTLIKIRMYIDRNRSCIIFLKISCIIYNFWKNFLQIG